MAHFFDTIKNFFAAMSQSSSSEAYNINNLFVNFLILSGIIVFIVAGMVVVGGYRYRRKVRPDEPPQITGNKRLELLWTILPFLTVTFFFVLTVRSMKQINRPFKGKENPDIVVIAHQWWWDIRYPKENVITANELHIPAGKKLRMRIESADVIHSWWVPALGRKTDAVPGRLNYAWIESDSTGEFQGACSEYCGTEHAWMRIKVVADSPEDYEAWIRAQQTVPPVPGEGPARNGAIIFQKKTCASCHSISGTPANSHIGPDLTHVGSRTTLMSGLMQNTPGNMRIWLKDPQKVKKGAHMPDFMLTKKEINDLEIYLEGLK